jgi:hypothetical protein
VRKVNKAKKRTKPPMKRNARLISFQVTLEVKSTNIAMARKKIKTRASQKNRVDARNDI